MPLQRVTIPPGVVKGKTTYSQEGRWTDSQWMRFSFGDPRPKKISGWEDYALATDYSGTCRGLFTWRLDSGAQRGALGTHTHFYTWVGDTLTDKTPVEESGTLGADPFTTTNASAEVTVADTTHTRNPGDRVDFSGASAVGGITIDGEYTVTTVIDANSYTITHSAAATSGATGGGASVAYTYYLPVGEMNATGGTGYGVGTYGSGLYGTERSGTGDIIIDARMWAIEKWGEDLLVLPTGGDGNVYFVDMSAGSAAAVVANAPTSNQWMFVTPERFVVCLGAAGSLLKVQWSDQDDYTTWTPASTNLAGSFTLEGSGSRLIGGSPVRDGLSIVLTEDTAYAMQYTADDFVYAFREAGRGCGLAGPKALIAVNGAAYWFSGERFWRYDGALSLAPNEQDVSEFVRDNINYDQRGIVWAGYNRKHNEIWWLWPATGSDECDSYVILSLELGVWSYGTLDRTAWFDSSVFMDPLATLNGKLYRHEKGLDADGQAQATYIQSGYFDLGDGDQHVHVLQFIPDFQRHVGDITVRISTKEYPTDTATDDDYTVATTDDVIFTRSSGRQAAIRFTSNSVGGDMALGDPRVQIEGRGRR